MGRRIVSDKELRQQGKNYKRGTQISYIRDFLGGLTDVCISIYMFLILVVLPFYHQEGYSHIGTDKSVFFRWCGEIMGKITIPVVVLYLISIVVVYLLQNGVGELKKLCPKMSVTDIFAGLYGISLILSYSQTEYKSSAWLGSAGWYMGFFPQMILVVSYFLISRAWKRHLWLLATIVPVSVIVFGLGIVNRFGYYPIDMNLESPMFISTIGNINWFCGYLVCIFFGAVFFYWQTDWKAGQRIGQKAGQGVRGQINWSKLLCLIYMMLGFVALIVQGSSSGILALAAVFLAMFAFSAESGKRMQAMGETVLCFSGMCLLLCVIIATKLGTVVEDDAVFLLLTNPKVAGVLVLFSFIFVGIVLHNNKKERYSEKLWKMLAKVAVISVCAAIIGFAVTVMINTLTGGKISDALGMPGENVLTFSPDWASKRGATWQAGAMCFASLDWWHKLVGAGPDCMEFVVKAEGNNHINAFVETYFGKGIRLTNAHNEWFTILINEGILGCVSFVGMILTAIYRFLKHRKDVLITGACGLCLLAYTVNNMVSFQQSLNVSTIFIVLAVGENYLKHHKRTT